MKYICLLIISFQFFNCKAQLNQLNKDSVAKYQLIYFASKDISSTTSWKTFSGEPRGSATSRSLIFNFKVGIDGDWMKIGRKGNRLKEVLKNDPEAYAEFRKAYKVHLRKKRICNTLEFVSYGTFLSSAIFLFVGMDNYEDEGITPPLVAGGAGVAASFAGILVFKNLTEKHMDRFAESLNRSVEIYNQNLLKKCK